MKNRNNNPISFGITLASANRTGNANRIHLKRDPVVRRPNTVPAKIGQMSLDEFDFPHKKMPPPDKPPFSPDMFITEPVPLPHFPPPRKISPDEESFRNAREHLRSRSEWHPSPEQSSSMAVYVPWDFFKVVFVGVFVFLKYAFIAVAAIITIGCMLCAGRQTSGLR
jgi:hypothetical protein